MEDGDIPYCKITAKRNCVVHDTSRRQRRCKLVVQSQRKVLRRLSLSATLILLSASYAVAAGKIYYGSRTGMTVTIRSMTGLDTAQAVIQTEHTRDDAIGFCKEYVQEDPVTEKCINDELSIQLSDVIQADCTRRIFSNFYGDKFQFQGRNSRPGEFGPRYLLMELRTRKIADGSSASGYDVNMDIFRALCPRTAPPADIAAGPAATTSTATPSFNCKYAKAPDEAAICQTPKLSEMDAKLASLYFGYQSLTSGPALHRFGARPGQMAATANDLRRKCGLYSQRLQGSRQLPVPYPLDLGRLAELSGM
jgi:hypothetical protein